MFPRETGAALCHRAARLEGRPARAAHGAWHAGTEHISHSMKSSSLLSAALRHGLARVSRATLTWALCLVAHFALAAPTLVSVIPSGTGLEVFVRYSEEVCASGAGFGAVHGPNYSMAPATPINALTLLNDSRTVRLDFAAPLSGSYTLTVNPVANYAISSCSSNGDFAGPVTMPFVVGTPTGPVIAAVTPAAIGTDCSATMTVHGSGFDATADVELNPGAIAGLVTSVNAASTVLTADFPSGITPGNYTLTVKNPLGASVYPGLNTPPYSVAVQAVTLNSSWPLAIGSCGAINITAYGAGLCPGATLKAIHQGSGTTVNGSSVVVSPGGNVISATFNFAGAPSGAYDLKAENPGGASDVGPYALNLGAMHTWQAYPNRIGACGIQTIQISGTLCPGDNVRLNPLGAGTIVPGTVVSVSGSSWSTTMTADFNMAGATPGDYGVEVQRGAGSWTYDQVKVKVLAGAPCPLDLELLGRSIVGYTRVNTFMVNVRNVSCAPVPASVLTVNVPAAANPTLSAANPGGVISPFNVITYNVPALAPGAVHTMSWDMLLPVLGSTPTLTIASSASGCSPLLHPMQVVASQDPNAKVGHPGTGANHYITGLETLPYEIHFENLSSATAPAQDVFVTDQLNPAEFDFATFNLGDFTYGNHTVSVPPGLTSYSTLEPFDMDGNPATTADQLLLFIDGKFESNPLDPNYGRLTWIFQSLDPITMTTPLNPLLGFLPPNSAPPAGEGSVKFTVKPQPNLAPGTVIGSAATIVFDANPPIATGAWLNEIIKVGPPLSIVPESGMIKIWWTPKPGTWLLEETSVLGPSAAWSTVSQTPVPQNDGTLAVLVPNSGQNRFYRLRKN